MAIARITEVQLGADDTVTVRSDTSSIVVRTVAGVLSTVPAVQAAPTSPPPVITPAPIGAIALGTLPPELTGLRMPARPLIARDVPIWNDADAREHGARPGTRLIVRAPLSAVPITASDVEVKADGFRCGSLTIARGLDRILAHGGTWSGVDFGYAPDTSAIVEDVTFDSMIFNAPGYAFKILSGRRIAILRCSGTAHDYSVWAEGGNGTTLEDLVIASCRFDSAGPESTCRLTRVRRAVVVDSRFSNPIKHNVRCHGASDRVWIARCVLVGGGSMLGTGMPLDALQWVGLDHCRFYSTTPDLVQIAAVNAVVRDNHAYRDADARAIATPHPGWIVENNQTTRYEAPPA